VRAQWEEMTYNTHHALDFAQFDVEMFGFLLLPIIIFSSAFNMEHHATIL